jgi:hypothetical protein
MKFRTRSYWALETTGPCIVCEIMVRLCMLVDRMWQMTHVLVKGIADFVVGNTFLEKFDKSVVDGILHE